MRRAGYGTTVINTGRQALFALSLGNLGQLLCYPEGVLRRHVAEALVHRRSTVGAQADFERRTEHRSGTPAY